MSNSGHDNIAAKTLQYITQYLYRGIVPKVDMHVHTNWTDGSDTVVDMYDRACTLNLKAMLFSEHSRRTGGSWFPDFVDEVRRCQGGCQAYVGVETRINGRSGRLEVGDDILERCDLVMASVHRFPEECKLDEQNENLLDESLEIELTLMLGAMDNPHVNIIGHPFGISMLRYGVQPTWEYLDILAKKAVYRNIAIEINTKYNSNPRKWIRQFLHYGVMLSFGSDAHGISEVGSNLTQLESDMA